MKRAPRLRVLRPAIVSASAALIVIIAASLSVWPRTVVQAQEAFLGNSGQRTVPPGTTYADHSGVWLCRPDDPRATAGGWVLTELPVTPSFTSTSPPPPTTARPARATVTPRPQRHTVSAADGDSGSTFVSARWLIALAAGAACTVTGGTAAIVLRRRLTGPRLTGWLLVEQEDVHEAD